MDLEKNGFWRVDDDDSMPDSYEKVTLPQSDCENVQKYFHFIFEKKRLMCN